MRKILSGRSDASVGSETVCSLLVTLGFEERVRGSHRIFRRVGVEEILNLHPRGSEAKPHQLKQVREVIVKYGLA
ncbi:MAG: type II toxin-antitoxin system HicA family toxin [Thermoanaerobaculia bacterium]